MLIDDALVIHNRHPPALPHDPNRAHLVAPFLDKPWCTVAVVGDLVAEGLLIDEDALAVETPNGKPRGLGTAAVAHVLGRLDAEGIAAESAGINDSDCVPLDAGTATTFPPTYTPCAYNVQDKRWECIRLVCGLP